MPEIKRFDPAEPTSSSLWNLTPVVSTGRFVEVTPERFSFLLKARPDLLEEQQRISKHPLSTHLRMYTLQHLALAVSQVHDVVALLPLLRLPPQQVDPAELAFRQTVTSYPSLAVKTIDLQQAPGFKYSHFTHTECQQFVASHFSEEELTPDLSKGFPTYIRMGLEDSAVSTYFAFHLIMASDFLTPDDLINYTAQRGISVKLRPLSDGFISLVAKNTIQALIREGLLNEQLVDKFYNSASEWQRMIALKRVSLPRRPEQEILPYPSRLRRDQLPAIRFLPNLVRTLLEFMIDLPLYVKEGGTYNHEAILQAVRGLNPLIEDIIEANLSEELRIKGDSELPNLLKLARAHKPALIREIVEVRDALTPILPSLLRTLKLFQRYPELLNRSRPGRTSPREVLAYRQIREEIQQSGGRAPKKPLGFRVEQGIRKAEGQI